MNIIKNKLISLSSFYFPIDLKDNFRKRLYFMVDNQNRYYFFRCINDIISDLKYLYYISIEGEIYSEVSNRFLSQSYDIYGYRVKSLSSYTSNTGFKAFKIHRLIKILFDYTPNHKSLEINHLNGIKDDNSLDNLEWCTGKENIYHAMDTGLLDQDYLDENIVRKICELIEAGERDIHIRKKFGLIKQTVNQIRNHQTFTHISKDYDIDKPMQPFKKISLNQLNQIATLFKMDRDNIIDITAQEVADLYGVTKRNMFQVKKYLRDKGHRF
jgi:hypothetical protein